MLDTDPVTRSEPPVPRRGRHWGIALIVAMGLAAAAAGVWISSHIRWCEGASGPQDPVTVVVPQGATGGDVADLLHERGVTRCGGFVGRSLVGNSGADGEIRAGTYEFTTNMTLDVVLGVLTSPPQPVPTVRLTVPEGYRLTQIAGRAAEDLGISAKGFLALAQSGGFELPPYLPEGTPTLEGFLFPKTYEFVAKGVTPKEVIAELLAQFELEVRNLPWESAERLGVSRYEVVVVASMIEEEARVASERGKIAAVIYNRLDRGMTLGIDATLLYDDPTPDGLLSASDLEYDSPYNTRLNAGLPPTPISSPGLPSLRAALEPAQGPFLYYVLCGDDGHHRFSSDYDVFLQDKARCLGG